MAVRLSIEEADTAPELEIGLRIREERKRRGMTLRELGFILGVSPSALSQIETGRSRPSVSTLYAIVNQLELSLDDLFSAKGQRAGTTSGETRVSGSPAAGKIGGDHEDFVVRSEARQIIAMESGVVWARLNPATDHQVEFREVTYDVGGSSSVGDTYMRHAGREYGVVMSGRLRVTVGTDTFELEAGDSVCFDSHIPHRLANIGEEPVRAVWFVIDGTPI
jgi:transcriptional regulator with XRE-family HTH domain